MSEWKKWASEDPRGALMGVLVLALAILGGVLRMVVVTLRLFQK